MTPILDLLEALGRGAALDEPDAEPFLARLPADARHLILARDTVALGRLPGARPFMACAVFAPDADEPRPDEQPVVPDDEPSEPAVPESRAA